MQFIFNLRAVPNFLHAVSTRSHLFELEGKQVTTKVSRLQLIQRCFVTSMEGKDLQKLSVFDLKAKLAVLKLPTTGNKHELIDRLVNGEKKKKQRVNESDVGFFNSIPDTWVHEVLIYVNATDLGRLSKTCTRFNKIIRDQTVWEKQEQKYIHMCKNYLEKRGPKSPFWTPFAEKSPNQASWRSVWEFADFKKFLTFLDKDLAWVHTCYLKYGTTQQIPILKLIASPSEQSEPLCDFLIRVGVDSTSHGELAILLNRDKWGPLQEEWYKIMVQREKALEHTYEADKDPLMIAASKRDLHIVKDLVERKLDVNAQLWSRAQRKEATPLSCAALAGRLEVVKYLVECGAKCNDAIFLQVCKKNPPNVAQMVAALHEAPGSFNVNAVDDHNRNALMSACKEGNLELVKWLLAHKANPNLQCGYGANDFYGDRAIFLGINSESPNKAAIVTALIKAGADVNVRDDYTDETPLSSTTEEDILKILKANGAKEEEAPWKQFHIES